MGKKLFVSINHINAADQGMGAQDQPFKSINHAAELAEPGDTIIVHEGIYRERINPVRSGEADNPIIYMAAPGENVYVRGSEVFIPPWEQVEEHPGVYMGALHCVPFGKAAYHGLLDDSVYCDNPYHLGFDRTTKARPVDVSEAKLPLTLGQVFVDGKPLVEVETYEQVKAALYTWIVSADGDSIYIHLPCALHEIKKYLIEISVRHAVFSPLKRQLMYIHVIGFIFEHCANHSPAWGKGRWAQAGMVSTRSGRYWRFENNEIRYAKCIGLDCGCEGGEEQMEFPGSGNDLIANLIKNEENGDAISDDFPGHHTIIDNHIHNNGHCGIAGIGHVGTKIIGNIIEKNNRTGYTSPWWEFAGIKFHFFYKGLIEGNLIRDNDAHGIWLDNNWKHSRVTRNVIVNNLWSGINIELGRGPLLIDNNIVAYTRQGSGVYGHDASDITIAHNLVYANYNFGVWFAYCSNRVKNEDGCWDIKTFNNMILGNRGGAIAYPMPWDCGGNNTSDNNLLMGAGEYLDEGSGPFPPLFQFTNKTHCGQFSDWCGAKVPMTKEVTLELFKRLAKEANINEADLPNEKFWHEHYWVTLQIWQELLGNDRNSRVTSTIKDGLQSRIISVSIKLDETVNTIRCKNLKGILLDFFGNETVPGNLKPGPFQNISKGQNNMILWPVRGIGSSFMLE